MKIIGDCVFLFLLLLVRVLICLSSKSIIIISDYLPRGIWRNQELKAVHALIQQGTLVTNVDPGLPLSVTSNLFTFLTGHSREVHGVIDDLGVYNIGNDTYVPTTEAIRGIETHWRTLAPESNVSGYNLPGCKRPMRCLHKSRTPGRAGNLSVSIEDASRGLSRNDLDIAFLHVKKQYLLSGAGCGVDSFDSAIARNIEYVVEHVTRSLEGRGIANKANVILVGLASPSFRSYRREDTIDIADIVGRSMLGTLGDPSRDIPARDLLLLAADPTDTSFSAYLTNFTRQHQSLEGRRIDDIPSTWEIHGRHQLPFVLYTSDGFMEARQMKDGGCPIAELSLPSANTTRNKFGWTCMIASGPDFRANLKLVKPLRLAALKEFLLSHIGTDPSVADQNSADVQTSTNAVSSSTESLATTSISHLVSSDAGQDSLYTRSGPAESSTTSLGGVITSPVQEQPYEGIRTHHSRGKSTSGRNGQAECDPNLKQRFKIGVDAFLGMSLTVLVAASVGTCCSHRQNPNKWNRIPKRKTPEFENQNI